MVINFGFMEILVLLFMFGMFLIFVKIISGIFSGFRRIKDIQGNTEQLQKEIGKLRREIADLREQIADLTIKLDNLNL